MKRRSDPTNTADRHLLNYTYGTSAAQGTLDDEAWQTLQRTLQGQKCMASTAEDAMLEASTYKDESSMGHEPVPQPWVTPTVDPQSSTTRCPCPAGCLYDCEYGLTTCWLCHPQNYRPDNGQCCCPCEGCYPDTDSDEESKVFVDGLRTARGTSGVVRNPGQREPPARTPVGGNPTEPDANDRGKEIYAPMRHLISDVTSRASAEIMELDELSEASSQGSGEAAMAERNTVEGWRTEHLLTDNHDFAYVFPDFAAAYSHSGISVAKAWSKARILATPEIYADKTKFNEIQGTTRKVRRLDRLKIARTTGICRTSPHLKQSEGGAGWVAEPLVQLAIECKLDSPDITIPHIRLMVTNKVNTTDIVILYRAVITTIELKEHLDKHQTRFGKVDPKVIDDFLWEARAQKRAAYAIVWMSNSLQLGWPVTELSEALGVRARKSIFNRYDWLKPICAETMHQPRNLGRGSLSVQPGMFKELEEAMKEGATLGKPTWLALLAIWLQALTGLHLKHILRNSFPVERSDRFMIFFRKVTLATVGKASHLQQGFYWAVPTATTSGYNWATPFLSEYKRRRHSDCGRKMMGMIFLTAHR